MPVEKYKAIRDLTFVDAGVPFTAAKVPDGVSLPALLLGGLVTVVRPPKPKDDEDDD